MSGPAWLAGSFAVLMIMIAVCCAARLAISRLRGQEHRTRHRRAARPDGRRNGRDARAAAHACPRHRLACGVRGRGRLVRLAGHPPRPPRRAGPAARTRRPHAVECAAMVYMLLPVGSWPSAHGPGMAMPGMSQGATTGNPALTLVLALFMLGYVLWAIDRLAYLSRTPAPATARATTARRPPRTAQIVPAIPGAAAPAATAHPTLRAARCSPPGSPPATRSPWPSPWDTCSSRCSNQPVPTARPPHRPNTSSQLAAATVPPPGSPPPAPWGGIGGYSPLHPEARIHPVKLRSSGPTAAPAPRPSPGAGAPPARTGPAIRPIRTSNVSCQRAGSTL